MKYKNKKQQRFIKKSAVFFVILFLSWFNLSRADIDGYNIFQDKDQDGLSDKEEFSYGTNPEKADTDGDGYSDKVEIESGYNPLKPAPGDKVVSLEDSQKIESENVKKKSVASVNLTDEFFKEIEKGESSETESLNQLLTTGVINENDIENLSLDENSDIDGILEELMSDDSIVVNSSGVSEEDVIILPKPTGTEEEVKEEEKEQIEKYMASIVYILAVNKPFVLTDFSDLSEKMSGLVFQINGNIQNGEVDEIKEFKEKANASFEQIKKVEAPYVLKEEHIKILSLHKTLDEDINEEKLVSDNDPLMLSVYLGKIQAALFQLEEIQRDIKGVLEEYEIEAFNVTSSLGLGLGVDIEVEDSLLEVEEKEDDNSNKEEDEEEEGNEEEIIVEDLGLLN